MSVAIELDALDFGAEFAAMSAPIPEQFDPADPADPPTALPRPARLRDAARTLPDGPFSPPSSPPVRRRSARAVSEAGVVTLLRPPASIASPVRLTRRGVVVLALAVATLGLALVWVAALSAPSSAGAPTVGPAVVTVHSGDSLWSIASRVAPQRSPAAEVAVLQQLNHLTAVDLFPGQQLRVR